MADYPADRAVAMALEHAALAIGRLDAALYAHPVEPAWRFWMLLDTPRRHAEVDGIKVDLYRLAAFLHGLPLKLGSHTLERGAEIGALGSVLALRTWLSQPDPEQERLRDEALTHLHRCGAGQPALLGAALGMRDWVCQGGSRAAIRAAVPLYLQARDLTRRPLLPLAGAAALKLGVNDPAGFATRFLAAIAAEADDARGLLWMIETAWREARGAVAALPLRSSSSLPRAVDVIAASPLLTVSALASALGCSVKGASLMLDELLKHGLVTEVTGTAGRGVRRLFGLKHLAPIRAETTASLRRHRIGGRRGRPKKILIAPFSELPGEPQGAPTPSAALAPLAGPTAVAPQPREAQPPQNLTPELRRIPLAFDAAALDRAMAEADAKGQHIRRLLNRIAAGERPFPDARTSDL